MPRIARRTAVLSSAGVLRPDISCEPRRWRLPSLILGAVLACVAALALAALPSLYEPGAHALASRHGSQSSLPTSLDPAVSASIGGSERSFWAIRRGASLRTKGGGIHGTFTASGAELGATQGTLGLSVAAVGRGRRLDSVLAVTPKAAANQIVYRHGSITEFYRNGPYGVEQGFTVGQRPRGDTGSLVLALRTGGSLIPAQVGSQILFRTHAGVTVLRYDQLSAVDASGHQLLAQMQIRNGSLELQINDSHARYPVRIDPFVQQGFPLAGKESGPSFGYSVALSSNGDTALVGAYGVNSNVGAAWIFTRSGGTWTEQAKLAGNEEVGKGDFGGGVALSKDGNTALIGGVSDNENVGAAWVFTRTGSMWSQQGAKLTGSEEVGKGWFGSSVALSGDGNTALIGGQQDSAYVGAAWVFTRSGSTWDQQEKLTGGGESGEGEFGSSVALSSDGDTALIGGQEDTNNSDGAAWIFTRSGSSWTQQGEKLTGSGTKNFGRREGVALSADGNTALIGGENAALVFTRSGSTWTQQGPKLTAGGKLFGWSVALSSDGNTALIGEREGFGPGEEENVGAAWIFKRSGSTWTEQSLRLTYDYMDGSLSGFSQSVALSSDGNTALVGGNGVAWVLTEPTAPTLETEAASDVSQTAATLNATVNPNGEPVSDCHFEYGTSTSYGLSLPCSSLPGSENSPVAVSASLTGLSLNTTYHFRIVATNATGTSEGADQTFTTQPNTPAIIGAAGSPTGQSVLSSQEHKRPPAHVDLGSASLAAGQSGAVSIKVSCPAAESSCTGKVTLRTVAAVGAGTSAHRSKTHKATILTLAVGAFTVAGGHVATITLHLSAKARALLAHTHVVAAHGTIVVHVDPADATYTCQANVTLRQQRPPQGHSPARA